MNSDGIDVVIGDVNSFVASHLWMDFGVWSFREEDLEISGTLDESSWSDFRIVFEGVCWASVRFQGWRSDTSRPVLSRVVGAEARSINARFQIEVGHHIFEFVSEDFDEPMWVAARSIEADFRRWDLATRSYGLTR